METIKLTEFKEILSGKYIENNKEYPLLLGIRENQKGNRFITMFYIDKDNNKIKILINWDIDELKEKVIYSILKNKKLNEKIEEYETLIKNFKEFLKVIKSLKLFSIIKDVYKFNKRLDINDENLAYWVYSKIYYGNIDKDTYIELVSLGENYVLDVKETTITIIAEKFIEKGLSKSEEKNLIIET